MWKIIEQKNFVVAVVHKKKMIWQVQVLLKTLKFLIVAVRWVEQDGAIPFYWFSNNIKLFTVFLVVLVNNRLTEQRGHALFLRTAFNVPFY